MFLRQIGCSDLFIVGSKQTNCVLAKGNAPLHASNDFAGTVIRAAKRKREWKLIIKEPVAVKPFSRRFNGTSCFIMLPRLTWTISQICISRMHAHLLFAPILASTITKFYIFEWKSFLQRDLWIFHFPSGLVKKLKKCRTLVKIRSKFLSEIPIF